MQLIDFKVQIVDEIHHDLVMRMKKSRSKFDPPSMKVLSMYASAYATFSLVDRNPRIGKHVVRKICCCTSSDSGSDYRQPQQPNSLSIKEREKPFDIQDPRAPILT